MKIWLALALVLSVLCSQSHAQSCHAQQQYPDLELVEAVRAKRHNLDYTGADEWAGQYVSSDSMTTSSSLEWSPATGFVVWREGCYPIPTNASFGKAGFVNDKLYLAPEVPLGERCSFAIANTFVAVRWGERHFLVPDDKLREFCFAVNQYGDEAPAFLCKVDDRDKPVKGSPILPAGYESLLLARPVRARVTMMNGREVLLDKGSEHGLAVGMTLGSERGDNSAWVEVVSVEAKSSIATLPEWWDDDSLPNLTKRRLSTRHSTDW